VTPTQFDPAAHPPLTDLGERLRELAGDAAYKAGRDYLRKGRVEDATVAVTTAYATVKGSTDYRISVAFPSVETTKVTCTCPAHRRNKFCKHVVAVCTALVEQPTAFAVIDAPPEPPASPAKKSTARKRGTTAAKTDPAELRAAGLEVLDRLLVELADGGLAQLGPEKVALIEQCAELVRALKLRRLGNLLMQLQRLVAATQGSAAPTGLAWGAPTALAAATPYSLLVQSATAEAKADANVASEFPRLLLDLYVCRAMTGAHLEGTVALDPRLAEDLVGKTWRAEELEPIGGLELVQAGRTIDNDGEFVIDTLYQADLGSREVYAEREITPARLRTHSTKDPHRVRLVVEEAGLYPGLAPRRIRLGRFTRVPLREEDVDRVLEGATSDLSEVQRRLVQRATVPIGQPEVAVLFRPAALLGPPDDPSLQAHLRWNPAGAIDAAGRFVELDWQALRIAGLETTLPADEEYAIFGLATQTDQGIRLRCLSIVGARAVSSKYSAVTRIFPAW
jgi:hypothetical protein